MGVSVLKQFWYHIIYGQAYNIGVALVTHITYVRNVRKKKI